MITGSDDGIGFVSGTRDSKWSIDYKSKGIPPCPEKIRLSPHFFLRDFLWSSHAAKRDIANNPENWGVVIRSAAMLCEKILEPILAQFGPFTITFGYACREVVETGMSHAQRAKNRRSSSPHMYDRGTWEDEVYARIDILPLAVEDGLVTKHEFGHWIAFNLDFCLLMTWKSSNVFCITISPRPRRVWIEWGRPSLGEPQRTILMGTEFWQTVYPTLTLADRPKFGPSCTGGSIQWSRAPTS